MKIYKIMFKNEQSLYISAANYIWGADFITFYNLNNDIVARFSTSEIRGVIDESA